MEGRREFCPTWLYMANDNRVRTVDHQRGRRIDDHLLYTEPLLLDLRKANLLQDALPQLPDDTMARYSHKVGAMLVCRLAHFFEDPAVDPMRLSPPGERIQIDYWKSTHDLPRSEGRCYFLAIDVDAGFAMSQPQAGYAFLGGTCADGVPKTHIFLMSELSSNNLFLHVRAHFDQWRASLSMPATGVGMFNQSGGHGPVPRLDLRLPLPFALLLLHGHWRRVVIPWQYDLRGGARFGYRNLRSLFSNLAMLWRLCQRDVRMGFDAQRLENAGFLRVKRRKTNKTRLHKVHKPRCPIH